MPDGTYSVKVSEETLERLKTLVETSGMNNKDFFTNLLSSYELQQAKENTPIISADIEEVENLTRRMNAIFINVSERINMLQHNNTKELQQIHDAHSSTLELLQQQIKTLREDGIYNEEQLQTLISNKEQAERKTEELQQQIRQLENAISDKSSLIEEYRQKNNTLTISISEYKTAYEKNKTLEQKNIELQQKIDSLDKLNNSLTDKLNEQATRHTSDIERLQDTLTIKYDKQILELKKVHQKEYQEQQDSYNDKVKSLLMRFEASQIVPTVEPVIPKESKTSGQSTKKAPAKSKKNTNTSTPESVV